MRTSSNFNEEILEVKIEKIVPNGFGLAFAKNLTIFVSLAAAGDKLRVKIREKKGKIAFAEIVEILEPSSDRSEPRCVYFGGCGGCDFQQMSYAAQLEAKAGIIRDCLTRIGKIEYEGEIPIIGSKPYGYRSRAAWHADTRRKRIGYFKRNSHEIIDVETCPILTPELQKALTGLRENIDWTSFWSEIVEVEAANSGEQISIYSNEINEPTREISFTAFGERYFYDADSFFQGNQFLIEPLIDAATKDAKGETALDLYCGAGLFTLPLARKFQNVVGVEGNEKAVEFAKKNLENAGIANAEIYTENVDEWLSANSSEFHLQMAETSKDGTQNAGTRNRVDFVLLDPPRAGTQKSTIENLLKIKPREISYVSCEPSLLSRDLRVLCESEYRIESITALDLFPQTHHVETVVRLKLRAPL